MAWLLLARSSTLARRRPLRKSDRLFHPQSPGHIAGALLLFGCVKAEGKLGRHRSRRPSDVPSTVSSFRALQNPVHNDVPLILQLLNGSSINACDNLTYGGSKVPAIVPASQPRRIRRSISATTKFSATFLAREKRTPKNTALHGLFAPVPNVTSTKHSLEDSVGPFLRITLFADDYEAPCSGPNHPKGAVIPQPKF